MALAIMRVRKLKRGSIASVGAHLGRLRDTPNADPSRTPLNEHIGTPAAELGAVIDERLAAIEERTGRKTRRDAIVAIEVLCTASPEWFTEHGGTGNRQQMANQALKWAYKEFGKKNVLSAELHLDETTPHLHMMVLPETPEGRLSAKIVVGDRNRLSALQDSYAEALSPLGIDRGVKGSKAKHTSIRQYYTETSKIEEARKKREEAEHLREEIEQQVKTTMAMREQLREEVDELGVARGLLGGVKEQQEKDKEIRELRERERQLQDEVVKLKGEVASYQGQVVDSSEDIELK